MSNSLWPHELQHARLPCPSLSPWACSNSCPLTQWRHPTTSSSSISFSSCPQSFPALGSFPMRRLFTSGSQSIGASVPSSVLPMNIQGSFPLGSTGLISLLFKDSLYLLTPFPHLAPSPSPLPTGSGWFVLIQNSFYKMHRWRKITGTNIFYSLKRHHSTESEQVSSYKTQTAAIAELF